MDHGYFLRTPDGKEFQVAHSVRIGRGEENEIQLVDGRVSRLHARVWMQDGLLCIADQESSNGTYVNGYRIQETVRLRPGDKIAIGDSLLQVAERQIAPPDYPTQIGQQPLSAPSQSQPVRPLPAQPGPATIPPPAAVKPSRPAVNRRPMWFVVGGVLVIFVCLVGIVAGAWLAGLFSKEDQPKIAALAVAIRQVGQGPALAAYAGPTGEETFWLPAGQYYIEAVDENGTVIVWDRVAVAAGEGGGSFVNLPASFTQTGGQPDAQRQADIQAAANFLVDVNLARLTALEILSASYKYPLYSLPGDVSLEDVDLLLAQYPGLLGQQENALAAITRLESRAGVAIYEPRSRVMARSRSGIVSGIFGFFGFLGGAGERASEQIQLIAEKIQDPAVRAEVFAEVSPALTGGAQNFDELLEKLRNGDLDNNAAQIRKQMLSSEPFYYAAQDVTKTDRVGLSIAHQEGSQFIEQGAALYVDIVKTVLTAGLPGIEQGFEYADKANEWAEYIRSAYQDPLGTLEATARDQIKSDITERIKIDLQGLFPDIDEEKLDELAGQIGEQIVGAIPELTPSTEDDEQVAGEGLPVPVGPGGRVQVPATQPEPVSQPTQEPTVTFQPPTATIEPSPAATTTPEPSPSETGTPDTSWIEGFVQGIIAQLIAEQYDPIAVAVFTDDLRNCLIAAVEDGATREGAMDICAQMFEELELTPTLTPTPINFGGTWHSPVACDSEAIAYRWIVSLRQDANGKVTGTISFHRCPGGGRVVYDVAGQAGASSVLSVSGRASSRAGDLGNTAVSPLTFSIQVGQPPDPNYAP